MQPKQSSPSGIPNCMSITHAIAWVIDIVVGQDDNRRIIPIFMRPYGEITKQILLLVGVAGIVVIVAAAPGVVLAAKLFEKDKRRFPKKSEKQKAARTLRRLQENNFLKVKKVKGRFVFELTDKGRRVFGEIQRKESQLAKLRISKPPHWDGKWRIVLFDIPDQSHKRARDILRAKLKEWEFYPLQKSAWVCPWPCENEIQLAAELYGISRYVNVVVAEKISDDIPLRKHFAL